MKLPKNPVFHSITKYIHIQFHFLQELVEEGDINLIYCKTEEKRGDIFTKPLKAGSLFKLREMIKLQS